MENTSIHKVRLALGFALIGAVAAGLLFGWAGNADAVRTIGAVGAVGLAKVFHFI